MKPAVEAIGEGSQVTRTVLGKVKGMVSAAETGLEVTPPGKSPEQARFTPMQKAVAMHIH